MLIITASAAFALSGLGDSGRPDLLRRMLDGHECLECRLAARGAMDDAATSGFDAATGRNLRNYPPHPHVHYMRMGLDLYVEDMNVPRMDGVQTFTLAAVGEELSDLTLNASLLEITDVECVGHEVQFAHDGQNLSIGFDPPLEPGAETRLVISFVVSGPVKGLVWTPESSDHPGRAAQLHTQGQPQTNSHWFPCHDFPNVRTATEISITVPFGYEALSNGRLLSKTKLIRTVPDGKGGQALRGFSTFRWVQDASTSREAPGDHAPYLVSLVVGKFDIVDVGTAALPMPIYAPLGQGDRVKANLGRTADMITFFSSRLDEPYPWSKYAQAVVVNFGAGGMENTSATTLLDSVLAPVGDLDDHDADGLNSHELAHQWFGDLITCRSWEHIWLNEGFATYLSALWFGHRDGPEAYQNSVRSSFDAVISNDSGLAPHTPAMASKVYSDPWEPFSRAANPYSKGSSILHMLRTRLGDEVFFRAVGAYIDRFKYTTVETNDFRRVLEEVSGESLEQFFAQWCYRPGVPRVAVTTAWNASSNSLTLHAEQTQTIDGDNPAFAFLLPVWVKTAADSGQWVKFDIHERAADFDLVLSAEPEIIAIDPELSVLADFTISQPPERWLAQLKDGPSHAAKVQACRALAGSRAETTVGALRSLATDRSANPYLRAEAVAAIAGAGDWRDVGPLLTSTPDQWRVRLAAIEAGMTTLGRLPETDRPHHRLRLIASLMELARHDTSLQVRASAIRALGTLNADGQFEFIASMARADSHSDTLRKAALDALVSFDTPEALPIAIELAAPRMHDRTRAAAAGAIRRLAHHDQTAARSALVALLSDRQSRVHRAAGEALAELGGAESEAALVELARSARDPADRDQADRWLARLRAPITAEPATP